MWFDSNDSSSTPGQSAKAPDSLLDFVFAPLAGCLLGAIAFVAALTIGVRVPGLWG